ncbi:hypothetical protein SAMN05216326_1123 [Nitrosomonas marina]|uniref:Uncharacterized protein n=1 Tax=Nitrosomonas marina TaxID=917 RepID=A0A1I0BTM6_9PROT|nr:hypothetical protein SAMN05216326_1123 [Nitrosomonas marina]
MFGLAIHAHTPYNQATTDKVTGEAYNSELTFHTKQNNSDKSAIT